MSVGLLYNGSLDPFLNEHSGAVDHISVIPERAWIDNGRKSRPRFTALEDEERTLRSLGERFPLVAHGIGLSIASAGAFDVAHLEELARWHRRLRFEWISEHLSAFRIATQASPDHHAGLALPLAWDDELLDLLTPRIAEAQERLGCRILLENGVVYTPVPDCEWTEAGFLNELCRRSGCALLLDLHNLHVNSVNLRFEAEEFLQELDLRNVQEIHIAGGSYLDDFYLDSHAGASPPAVWGLLARVLPQTPSLRGLTFEFHESYYPTLGIEGVGSEIDRARRAWLDAKGGGACRSQVSRAHSRT